MKWLITVIFILVIITSVGLIGSGQFFRAPFGSYLDFSFLYKKVCEGLSVSKTYNDISYSNYYYDPSNVNVKYHTAYDVSSGGVGESSAYDISSGEMEDSGMWVRNVSGELEFVAWINTPEYYTYYKPGSLIYGPYNYVPSYKDTVYLKKYTNSPLQQ